MASSAGGDSRRSLGGAGSGVGGSASGGSGSGLGADDSGLSGAGSAGPSGVMEGSLFAKLKASLLQMLNLNRPVPVDPAAPIFQPGANEEVWKVLVMDQFCVDVVGPVLRVGDLRKLGVTLNLMLDQQREAVSDVPALYFVEPTQANVDKIIGDFRRSLYDSYFVNFCAPVKREQLQALAAGSVTSHCAGRVQQVVDQFLDFTCMEPNLFTLLRPNTFLALNDPSKSESALMERINSIVDGIFSVVVTMEVTPYICAMRGEAAEMVATKLDEKLRAHLYEQAQESEEWRSMLNSRPVLLIVDRSLDLGVCLHHPWTYKALVHDVLGMNLNRVTVELATEGDDAAAAAAAAAGGGAGPSGAPAARKQTKKYDLSPEDDFWMSHGLITFERVMEDVDAKVRQCEDDINTIRRKTGIDVEADPTGGSSGTSMEEMTSGMRSIPELLARKKSLAMHTNIAATLLRAIKARDLHSMHLLEQNILHSRSIDFADVQRIIEPTHASTVEDKLRLFLMYYLLEDNISRERLALLEQKLTEQRADMSAYAFLRQLKTMQGSLSTMRGGGGGGGGRNSDMLSSFANKFRMLGDHVKAGLGMHSGSAKLPVTKTLQVVMDGQRDASEHANLFFLDPKAVSSQPTSGDGMPRNFQKAIVLTIGGGTYAECQNVFQYAAETGKYIAYGSTDIVTGGQFLSQLEALGRLTSSR